MRAPAAAPDRFGLGIDDTIIVPLVVIAVLARTICQAVLVIVLFASDLAFALFLRVMSLPLLVATVAGDVTTWLIKRRAGQLPPGPEREAWRDSVDRRWSGLRQRMSHQAVAKTVLHALGGGLSWFFEKCGALSPRAALLVIAGVMLWLPLSAAISIAMHAILLAHATSLPAWMQLLHPVATVIAKSKFLVLPAYPAAWPQAKKHAWVQTALQRMQRVAALDRMRKTAHRYQQTRRALAHACDIGAGIRGSAFRRRSST